MEQNIKVVATPQAYEVIMNADSPGVHRLIDWAFHFMRCGIESEEHGTAMAFPDAPLYFRIFHARSSNEHPTIIITHDIIIDDVAETLETALPLDLV